MAVAVEGVAARDVATLRELAKVYADAAASQPTGKAELWRRLNDRDSARPMVWLTEVPWHEMNVDDELTLRCEGEWARRQEWGLRTALYAWRHFPVDSLLDDHLTSPLAIRNTGFGLGEQVDVVRTDPANSVVSRHFHPQIVEPRDVEKIKRPEVSHDEDASAATLQRMQEVYDGVLPVRQVGIKHIWFTPWDNLIRWWGVQQAMTDLVDRPEMVNEAVERCVDSMLAGLDQMVAQNLLSPGAANNRVGSGGYGYASDLAAPADPERVLPADNWGCSNAQIFSEVSPAMHWEFALRHDIPWLERWGLNYYGCCEPLHHKVDILRRIPNLRKVSMNYRIDPERAGEAMGDAFVFSYKPNPALLAGDTWRPDEARAELEHVLACAQGCHVEIIMKDISTVSYQPQRLWDWGRIAMEVAEAHAG